MHSKPWTNCSLPIIPEKNRVRQLDLAICKGGCNRLTKITNTSRQMCGNCTEKRRYLGELCEVPDCQKMADGTNVFRPKDGYMLCFQCYEVWINNKDWVFERLIEERSAWLARPETFVKALKEGLISPVKNPVKTYEVAECQFCKEVGAIGNTTYQLCSKCRANLQYHGEKCFVCSGSAHHWDRNESLYNCANCGRKKVKYGVASFSVLKYQIASHTQCMICQTAVYYGLEGGTAGSSMKSVACIDHDHRTGKIRGILCYACNTIEGFIEKMDCPEEWAKKLVNYLENPPLDIQGLH